MTLYHAWIPNSDGTRPIGGSHQTIATHLKTDLGAVKWAKRWAGEQNVHVDRYADSIAFYANRGVAIHGARHENV